MKSFKEFISEEHRTKDIDFDARRDPKTNHYCVACQKDLKQGQKHRTVHMIKGGYTALHPEDEHKYKPDSGDMGHWPIGMDCAKKLGLEWTHEKKD